MNITDKSDKYYEDTKDCMIRLGIYKKEFETSIRLYVDARLQYEEAWEQYKKSGMINTVECAGGVKKNPLLIVLEEARKQVGLWSDKLGLNPKAHDSLKKADAVSEQTGLESCLGEISNVLKGFNNS